VTGEAIITSDAQRRIVSELFARSRTLAQWQGQEQWDGKGIFQAPTAREFALQVQQAKLIGSVSDRPPLTRRLYAEIRDGSVRLALSRGFKLG